MNIAESLFMVVIVAFVALFALLIVVSAAFVLVGLFAKGYNKTREEFIKGRNPK